MRECLGWITNCPNGQICPQNWLELSVSELPITVPCHVCEQNVDLVTTADDLDARAQADLLVAFPVVPCTGFGAAKRAPESAAVRPAPDSAPAPGPAPTPARRSEDVVRDARQRRFRSRRQGNDDRRPEPDV